MAYIKSGANAFEYVYEREVARWRHEALAEARTNPAFADRVAELEARIGEKRTEQREIMELAGLERRTLDYSEARSFRVLQGAIDEAQSQLNVILGAAKPRPMR